MILYTIIQYFNLFVSPFTNMVKTGKKTHTSFTIACGKSAYETNGQKGTPPIAAGAVRLLFADSHTLSDRAVRSLHSLPAREYP